MYGYFFIDRYAITSTLKHITVVIIRITPSLNSLVQWHIQWLSYWMKYSFLIWQIFIAPPPPFFLYLSLSLSVSRPPSDTIVTMTLIKQHIYIVTFAGVSKVIRFASAFIRVDVDDVTCTVSRARIAVTNFCIYNILLTTSTKPDYSSRHWWIPGLYTLWFSCHF